MKKIKSILSIFMIIAIALGGSGCSMTNYFDRNKGVSEITEYLNNKYDDTFTYVGKYGGTFDNDKNEYEFKSLRYPEYSIWVAEYRNTGDIVDNYLEIKYHQDIGEKIDNLFSSVCVNDNYFIDNDINISKSSIANISGNISLEEFITNKSANLKIYAIVDAINIVATENDFINALKNEIEKSGICFTVVDIYFVNAWTDDIKSDADLAESIIANEGFSKELYATIDDESNIMNWEWNK